MGKYESGKIGELGVLDWVFSLKVNSIPQLPTYYFWTPDKQKRLKLGIQKLIGSCSCRCFSPFFQRGTCSSSSGYTPENSHFELKNEGCRFSEVYRFIAPKQVRIISVLLRWNKVKGYSQADLADSSSAGWGGVHHSTRATQTWIVCKNFQKSTHCFGSAPQKGLTFDGINM